MNDLALWGAQLVSWLRDHAGAAAVVLALLAVPGVAFCWAARRGARASRQALANIDRRLTQISSAVELLTDTTESALRLAFTELERISAESQARMQHRAELPGRVTTAARNGRSAREIAQSEGVSEGEVRLRLRLQDAAASASTASAP